MDPAQALADLTEISSQIEAAVLADASGGVLASTFSESEKGERLARSALSLIQAAERAHGAMPERLVQLEAATADGSLLVVRDEARLAAAVTGPDPTSGLVFYDLKTCLRLVGEEKPAERKARRRDEAATAEGAGGEAT